MKAHLAILLSLLFSLTLVAFAQTEKPATAFITGRITFKEQPVPGITVTLESARPTSNSEQIPISAKTNADGRYSLTGLTAGTYVVSPRALAYVLPVEGGSRRPGKNVSLSDGETLENLDFALVKGGVISGTITDYTGRPVIGHRVRVKRLIEGQPVRDFTYGSYRMYDTDDRGTYRLFGLSAGRYKVGLGDDKETLVIGRAGGYYRLTYYPGVTDEAEAKVIEVNEGSEVTDIDFKVSKPEKTYEAKGRLIDGTTGSPLPGFNMARGMLSKERENYSGYGYTADLTDTNGEFVMRGLSPGRYATFPVSNTNYEYYSDPTVFEVANSDVEGLEVKAYRGAAISGVVVIEGTTDPAVQKLLTRLSINAYVDGKAIQSPPSSGQVNPNGTFRVPGLRPGKARLSPNVSDTLMVARIERDGIQVRDVIEVAGAEQISGVKIVMTYSSATLRGQINVVGGTMSPDKRLFVWANHATTSASRSVPVDTRGRFALENLAPGEYKLSISQSVVAGTTTIHTQPTFIQNVTVGPGETTVTLTLDLNTKKEAK